MIVSKCKEAPICSLVNSKLIMISDNVLLDFVVPGKKTMKYVMDRQKLTSMQIEGKNK